LVVDLFRSRAALEAEVLVLKQQIIVLRRGKSNRRPFLAVDRFVLGWVCHLFPKAYDALAIFRPDTVVRWHHAGFRLFWRWKSRRHLGRPAVPTEIRQLIREMNIANPLRPTRSLAWHSRSSDLSTLALAERTCGAFDWLNPPGMPRPYCCYRRATPAPHPHVLHGVLQRSANASLIRQGCAG
jgi:hypothetical protein